MFYLILTIGNYLSTYPLTMSDLGLSSNLNLSDLNLDHVSSSMTSSTSLTPMRPYTSKLFSHTNGGSGGGSMSNMVGGGGGLGDDKGPKPGSTVLDPNATAYTPKTMGNGEL